MSEVFLRESFFACTSDIAKTLDTQMTEYLEPILAEFGMVAGGDKDPTTTTPTAIMKPLLGPMT